MKSDLDTVFVNIDPRDHRLDHEATNNWVILFRQQVSELRGKVCEVLKTDRLFVSYLRSLRRPLRLKKCLPVYQPKNASERSS